MNSRKIFMEAPVDASPEVLASYLETVCAGDLELKAEVEALFEAARESGEQFLERPPIARGDGVGGKGSDGGLAGDEIEGYKLLQKIGEGGFGEVYMAEQLQPFRRRVAVKIIKLGMDTRQVVARFEAERQALAMMEHTSIAKVFDAGATSTGRPFFVMELVKGVPITQFCDDNKLKTDERLRLFMEVCNAVQHAHQKGVIHRDLKPSNVMVTMLDDKPVPKVIDFGVAKATQVELTDKTLYTRYEQFIGTPAYMSPEQAQMSGMDIDTRSDIYALGVLLYELLTGRPPFDAKELERAGELEIRRKICEDEPPRPSTRFATMGEAEQKDLAVRRRSEPRWLEARLRGDVDWIVMKTLEKERARRYETANGLAADIGRALADEPVEAGPPDLGYRLLKMIRKHRVALGTAAVLATVLVAATAVSLSGWKAAVANRDLFETEAERALSAKGLAEERLEMIDQASKALKEEVEHRQEAQLLAEERRDLVSFLRAEELLATGNAELGVAQLASMARKEAGQPIGKLAAERLSSALRYRSFAIPESEPISGGDFSQVLAAVGPDGERAAMLWYDGTLRAWDSESGAVREVAKIDGSTHGLVFSPNGRWVAVLGERFEEQGGFVGFAEIIDIFSGERVGQVIGESRRMALGVFSPDGRLFLTGSDNRSMQVWSYDPGSETWLAKFHAELNHAVVCGDFAPEGTRFVVGCYDGTVQLWDISADELVRASVFKHVGRGWRLKVRAVEFSPDGGRIASGSSDGIVRIWDTEANTCVAQLQHDHLINDVAFDPSGTLLATASFDKTVRLWSAEDGRPMMEALRHGGNVTKVRFSRGGDRLLTASDDGSARVWDVFTGVQVGGQFKQGHPVTAAEFTPDGKRVLTAGGGTGLWWRPQVLQPKSQVIRHTYVRGYTQSGGKVGARFSPDGKTVLSNGIDGKAKLTEVETGRLVYEGDGGSGCFSPDGSLIATAFSKVNGRIRGLEVRSVSDLDGAPIWKIEEMGGIPGKLAFDSETKLLAVGVDMDGRGKISVFDMVTRAEIASIPLPAVPGGIEFNPSAGRPWMLVSLADGSAAILDARSGAEVSGLEGGATKKRGHHSKFSSDGELVVTVRGDNTVAVWEAATGEVKTEGIRHSGRIHDARISPDGSLVATASADHTARLWVLETGMPQGLQMRHGGAVRSLCFSADGARLVSGSKDGTVRIWDTRYGLPLSEPLEHGRWVDSVDFSADGRHVLGADKEAVVRIWEAPLVAEEVPAWLPDWCEAVAGQRIDGDGMSANMAWEERRAVIEGIQKGSGDAPYGRLARWFHQDPVTRPISPFKPLTREELFENLLADGGEAALREVPYRKGASLDAALREVALRETALREAVGFAAEGWRGVALAKLVVLVRSGVREDGDMSRSLLIGQYEQQAIRLLQIRLEREPGDLAAREALILLDISDRLWDWRTEGAIPAREELVAIRRQLLGDDHHLTLEMIHELSRAYEIVGRHRDALPLLREVLDRRRRLLGPDDELTGFAAQNLGRALDKVSMEAKAEGEEAIAVFREALRVKPNNGKIHYWLGRRLVAMNRLEEGVASLREGSERLTWGEESYHVRRELAGALEKLGREEEAAETWLQLAEFTRAVHPGTPKPVATLVAPDSEWKWFHPLDGRDPAGDDDDFHRTFYTDGFDDSGWQSGRDSEQAGGGFGYGEEWLDGVDIGLPESVDEDGKRNGKSAYFRHRFTTGREHANLELWCQRDDGVVIYLDGKEVARDNMGDGEESYRLAAARAVGSSASARFQERTTYRIPLSDCTLPAGEHILAISLHNTESPSSDLRIGGIKLVEVGEVE